MHRERIRIYSRIKDSRDAAAAAFFLSGPSNRDIMHRQPSTGVYVRRSGSSDWKSAVQFIPVRSGSNTVLGAVHREIEVTRPGLEEFSGVSSQHLFHWHFLHFCEFKGEGGWVQEGGVSS